MNALIAMAKRLSIVLDAMGQESGLWDFTPATAKNAQARERPLVLSAAGPALFQQRQNRTEPLPARAVARSQRRVADSPIVSRAPREGGWTAHGTRGASPPCPRPPLLNVRTARLDRAMLPG
jgi:hypothetical protein